MFLLSDDYFKIFQQNFNFSYLNCGCEITHYTKVSYKCCNSENISYIIESLNYLFLNLKS